MWTRLIKVCWTQQSRPESSFAFALPWWKKCLWCAISVLTSVFQNHLKPSPFWVITCHRGGESIFSRCWPTGLYTSIVDFLLEVLNHTIWTAMWLNKWLSPVRGVLSGWAQCGIPSARLSHDPDVRRLRGSPRIGRVMNISLGLERSIPFHCINIQANYWQTPQNQGCLYPHMVLHANAS